LRTGDFYFSRPTRELGLARPTHDQQQRRWRLDDRYDVHLDPRTHRGARQQRSFRHGGLQHGG
jgi:hypothetical protein